MIKSVFAKYILAFLAIITISFGILVAVISSAIVQHSIEAKKDSMATAARLAKQNIETGFAGSPADSLGEFIDSSKKNLTAELSEYTELAGDSFILIADTEGNIIFSAPPSPNISEKNYISRETMRLVLNNTGIEPFQTLDGVFSIRHLVSEQILTYKNGETAGALFVCSDSAYDNGSVKAIINIIISSCMWILVAAMVLLYFITEKIIAPVRAMSKAVRSFALGHFDVRIPETANKDEIGELASAFNKMAASLAVHEETQRTFLSNVSHDLRTPMTSIGGFVDNILNGTIPPEDHEYYLKRVSAEIQRLSRLVNRLLDISRMQAGETKFNKANFDIFETARLVLISLEQKINEKNIEIEFARADGKTNVFADADATHQIIQNLLENAVKFTPEKGLIRIDIDDSGKEKVRVSVYNTGTGISPEDIPFVFDRFYKSDRSRGLDKTGVGLGLFIVKTIIDAHEEKIWVESEYEKNCEFIFTLQKAHETGGRYKI